MSKSEKKAKSIQNEVYEPAEDSYLLEKYVSKFTEDGINVLDIGTGSGIQALTSLKKGAKVTAVDINPDAIRHCKNRKELSEVEFLQGDLFSPLKKAKKEEFDLIIFNPPYLPAVKEPEKIKLYTTGGKHGYEIIDRFMSEADSYLKPNGIILIVFSSLTKKMKVDESIRKYMFDFELLEEQGLFFERLYCYKITRSAAMIRCKSIGVTGMLSFAKGRRGLIYKSEYKKKHCVVKCVNPETNNVVNTLENEEFWLKYLNKLKIGPKLYYADNMIVVMEFLDGKFILDYLEENKSSKKKIALVIMGILDQMILFDMHCLEKLEMTRPLRHVIVTNNKPVLIDFERTRKTTRPGNVTQYLQFLACPMINGKYMNLDRKEIISLSIVYMKDRNIRKIKNYLENALK